MEKRNEYEREIKAAQKILNAEDFNNLLIDINLDAHGPKKKGARLKEDVHEYLYSLVNICIRRGMSKTDAYETTSFYLDGRINAEAIKKSCQHAEALGLKDDMIMPGILSLLDRTKDIIRAHRVDHFMRNISGLNHAFEDASENLLQMPFARGTAEEIEISFKCIRDSAIDIHTKELVRFCRSMGWLSISD